MTAVLGIEPDETAVRASRSTVPPLPAHHRWKIVCRRTGLRVDEQVACVLDRLRPHTGRLAALAGQLDRQEGPGFRCPTSRAPLPQRQPRARSGPARRARGPEPVRMAPGQRRTGVPGHHRRGGGQGLSRNPRWISARRQMRCIARRRVALVLGVLGRSDNAAWGHLPCPKGYGGVP
ncbi:DUF4279 domain-containing protein [Streptomyces sp. NBC_00467]